MKLTARFRNVSVLDWAWVNFFLAVGIVWPLSTLWDIPAPLQHTIHHLLILAWLGLTMVGAVTAVTGILMYSRAGTRWRPMGAAAELGGLVLMVTGPTLFTLVNIDVYFTHENHGEIHPTIIGLAFAVACGVAVRFAITIPRFHREATDDTKIV